MNDLAIYLGATLIMCGLFGINAAIVGFTQAYKDAHATCPGPLQAGDYYTPEE